MTNRGNAFVELRKVGVSLRDALAGLALSDQLERVDKIAFPNSTCDITIYTFAHELGFPLQYTRDIDRDPIEMYEVYLPGIAKEVMEVSQLTQTRFKPVILQMAIHEVRHRMQHSLPELRLFTPGCHVDPTDQLLQEAVEYVRGLFERRQVQLEKEGLEGWLIKHRTSQKEFDAVVISLLATRRRPRSNEEIGRLLQAQSS